MRSLSAFVISLFTASATLAGCAVLPFAPAIAHVAPRILFPGHDPNKSQNSAQPADDTPLETASKSDAPPAGQSMPVLVVPSQLADGSIPLRMTYADPTSDLKAHAIGDVLTVNVSETINGQSSAQTTLTNKRTASTALPNMFSAVESLAKHNPLLNLSSLLNGTSENDASGQGAMTANDTFAATVSVLVVGVSPSGLFKVAGDRKLRINGEDDTIHLSGLVRPQDIDSNNSIASGQIADLSISFTGSGLIRDKQGGGWGFPHHGLGMAILTRIATIGMMVLSALPLASIAYAQSSAPTTELMLSSPQHPLAPSEGQLLGFQWGEANGTVPLSTLAHLRGTASIISSATAWWSDFRALAIASKPSSRSNFCSIP